MARLYHFLRRFEFITQFKQNGGMIKIGHNIYIYSLCDLCYILFKIELLEFVFVTKFIFYKLGAYIPAMFSY